MVFLVLFLIIVKDILLYMKYFFCLILFVSFLSAEEAKVKVNNAILAKVNGTTISVIDVKKRMDFAFYKNFPKLVNNPSARAQFYAAQWKTALNDMIDTELIITDAAAKDLKITDGEIREEMESRFGPSVPLSLEKMGLSYDEAWKMVKTEMTVTRMNWFYAHSKALQAVTPQVIKQAYSDYISKNSTEEKWQYQIISLKTTKEEAEKIYSTIKNKDPSEIKGFEDKIQISRPLEVTGKNISDSLKSTLSTLKEKSYSKPISTFSRFEKGPVMKIFYLKSLSIQKAPSFEELSGKIREELLQKVADAELNKYLGKLKKKYGIEMTAPKDLMPFVIE